MNAAPLWTAQEAALATGGRTTGDWNACGVSIDSRSVAAGDLFVALQGPNFDGHNFVAAALAAGAAAALVHRRPEGLAPDAPLLMVEDTMAALTTLGAQARNRSEARFIGVTGSVGKTGTKEALYHCLAAQGPTAASAASLNNHWGVPLSLARMSPRAIFGVFEMGMNHAGEIRELTRLVRPHVAVVTTVEAAHSEFFDSIEDIARAKAEIFEGVEPQGAAILNRDNAHYELLAAAARGAGIRKIIGFGRHPEAEARLINSSLQGAHSTVRAIIEGVHVDYSLGLPGGHWVMNSLAVLAAIWAVGADLRAATADLATLKPLKGRGARMVLALPGGNFELIDDSYNANPTSMRAAFSVLQLSTLAAGGRRIAVLGDMLELGPEAEALHAGLADAIGAANIDLVFTCGPMMAALQAALPKHLRGGHAADSQRLVPLVTNNIGPGDTVLVKGSLGSRMAVVIDALHKLGDAQPRAANGH